MKLRALPAYEYVDVDLEQRFSTVQSRWRDLNLTTYFSRRLRMKRPFVSAAMDTVTGSEMAIVMAEEGGLGVLHRFLSVEAQAREAAKVKRAAHFIIDEPYTLTPRHIVRDARRILQEYGIGGIIIVENSKRHRALGVLTRRDVAGESEEKPVGELMNAGGKRKLVSAPRGTSLTRAAEMLHEHRLEKLPIVDRQGVLCGLITEKDIANVTKHPNATRDRKGRLAVAAAVGIRPDDYRKRAEALVAAGTDVLVIDVAHGGLSTVRDAAKHLTRRFPETDIIVGNVMTAELTKILVKLGVAGVKVGIAPGYACRTRSVTGVGGGQLSVVMECAKAVKGSGVPVCADGGIRELGDIGKALAAGASSVMMGSFFAGTDESPGHPFIGLDGRKQYLYRGMASFGANMTLRQMEGREFNDDSIRVTPEGEHLMVPAKGSVRDILRQMEGALRSTMSYLGARTIGDMSKRAVFRVKARRGS